MSLSPGQKRGNRQEPKNHVREAKLPTTFFHEGMKHGKKNRACPKAKQQTWTWIFDGQNGQECEERGNHEEHLEKAHVSW